MEVERERVYREKPYKRSIQKKVPSKVNRRERKKERKRERKLGLTFCGLCLDVERHQETHPSEFFSQVAKHFNTVKAEKA